jgi:SAM-dependent methyltransferase
MDSYELEPASFRDPGSSVFYTDGRVYRGLGDEALGDWNALAATSFFPALLADGRVVRTELLEGEGPAAGAGWAGVLEHETIPFVSYPYEWTFGMLKDAALLHLDILHEALAEAVTMKDGYAYNVQWRGSQPTFIDLTSFERAGGGGPWAGYRQFCQTFLYPLMLQAYKDVSFQPWLRGAINGIEPSQMRNLLSLRDKFRRGVFKHIVLHTAVEQRFAAKGATKMTDELKSAGFSTELTRATVGSMRKLVGKLSWKRSKSTWNDYRSTCTYTDADAEEKGRFVQKCLGERPWELAWDLGCNDGLYSRMAAEHAGYVVATDLDELVVDHLYRSLREEGNTRILPLTMNLADPSPNVGWRGLERRSFTDRRRPDVVLALALIHHLVIGANLPLGEVVDWLRGLGAHLVIEFVAPNDPQTERLLANKVAGQHDDYRQDNFERVLGESFEITARDELPSGTRVMYFARPR